MDYNKFREISKEFPGRLTVNRLLKTSTDISNYEKKDLYMCTFFESKTLMFFFALFYQVKKIFFIFIFLLKCTIVEIFTILTIYKQ